MQDEVHGPYELVELAAMLRSKYIDENTPICAEGSEEWINFNLRPEYNIAREIPLQVIEQKLRDKEAPEVKPWTWQNIKMLLWIMAPVLLYFAFRCCVYLMVYHKTVHHYSN